MRSVYKKTKQNKSIYIVLGVMVTLLIVIAITGYFVIFSSDDVNVYAKEPAIETSITKSSVVIVSETGSTTDAIDDSQLDSTNYQNIDSAHDFVNFEYLIKEIGDATED